MLKDPLGDKIASPSGIALGAWTSDPDMIELLAYLGFDWVMIDLMFTGTDWSRAEMLIRTAEAAGITPLYDCKHFHGSDMTLAWHVTWHVSPELVRNTCVCQHQAWMK